MDKAPIRRGKQTVHEKWNDNIAILSGDVMLVNAYQYLNKVKGLSLEAFQHLLGRLSRIAAEVCEGQQFDMNFESRDDVAVEEYIEMIRLKTSVLIGFSMEMGGLLASAPAEVSDSLYRIGETIGLGFQLKDDLLDVYGDPEKFGKQPGGDILANKKTYLLIKAFERATGSTLASLEKWVDATDYDAAEKVQAVTAIYDSLGLKAETEAVIASYFDTAFMEIQSLAISKKKKSALVKFMSGLVDREV